MFWLGIEGMRRRVADYPPELGAVNLWVSIAGFNVALSVGLFIFVIVRAWRTGPRAVPNPWRAQTLEWQIESPPPIDNFGDIPAVTGTPYQYGSPAGAPIDRPAVEGAPS
jgi:cytochrome c oxidase subunit 1